MISLLMALATVTPQGWELTAAPMRDYPEAVIAAGRATGTARGPRRVVDTPGTWFEIYLAADSAMVWPQGQRVALVLASGERVPCLELFAMSPLPHLDPIYLPGPLDPKDLWRTRRGRVILFARFPALPREAVGVTITGGKP